MIHESNWTVKFFEIIKKVEKRIGQKLNVCPKKKKLACFSCSILTWEILGCIVVSDSVRLSDASLKISGPDSRLELVGVFSSSKFSNICDIRLSTCSTTSADGARIELRAEPNLWDEALEWDRKSSLSS